MTVHGGTSQVGAETGDTGQGGGLEACAPETLLRMVGEQLVSRGLRVRERLRGGQFTEIEATNPRDPTQSRVILGCDGCLIWERWCAFRTAPDALAIAQAAATILDDNIVQHFGAPPGRTCPAADG